MKSKSERSHSSVVILSLALALCSATGAHARADVVERVVATVNDDAIFLSELRRRSAPYLEQALSGTSKDEQKSRIKDIYEHVLGQLIDEELIEQTSRKMSIIVSSVDIDQAIENVRTQNSLTSEQFWDAVRAQGFTEKQYREDVRKQLLRLKVTNQRVRARVNVTEDTVKDEYEQRMREARRRQRFHAAHIFAALSETASATEVAAAMKEARTMRSGLTAETFDAKMSAHGGGDLGWLDQGDLPPELEMVLLSLEPGQISEPVRSKSGVHIFMLRERQAGATKLPSFEEAKEALHRELMDKAMSRQQELFLTELRRSAVIDKKP